jgi:hypothetical protein
MLFQILGGLAAARKVESLELISTFVKEPQQTDSAAKSFSGIVNIGIIRVERFFVRHSRNTELLAHLKPEFGGIRKFAAHMATANNIDSTATNIKKPPSQNYFHLAPAYVELDSRSAK